VTLPHGTNQHTMPDNEDSDNVTILDGRGNSKSYTLDRLKREAPSLYQRVCANEMSGQRGRRAMGLPLRPLR
jgi:hypothetical protein